MLVLRKESPEEYLEKIRKEKAQNSKNCFGIPTLCSAIHKFRSVELVGELLKDGATVNAFTCMNGMRLNGITRDRNRQWGEYSAIHLAVSLGQYEIVSLLLDYGADITSKTTKGIESLEFIVDPYLRCQPDEIQITENDDLELLKIMKSKDLDLCRKNHDSKSTLLHRAVVHRCLEIVRYLISVGFDVNCVDWTSSTALHYCNMEAAKILLENNADPNVQDENGYTLYHRIFGKYHNEGEKNLLDFLHLLHKFNANPNIQNNSGETALHECLRNVEDILNPIKLIDFMLKQGADPKTEDIFERTPVYNLVCIQNPTMLDLIRLLLAKLIHFGASLDHPDITGTPLFHTLVYGHLFYPHQFDAKLWNEILHPKNNVNLNVQDYYNRTVFHLAAAKGDWKLGEVFFKYGGNLDMLDCDGNTPLDVAILCKQWEFAKKALLWPFGRSRGFRMEQVSGRIDEDTIKNTISNGSSGCESLLFRSLALANHDDNFNNYENNNRNVNNKNDNDNNKNDNDNNKNDNDNNRNDNNKNGNDDNKNDNDNNRNDNNKNDNDSNDNNNQNQRHAGALKQLQRSNSMPSFESTNQDEKSVIPLGSSVKWTKNKLDSVAKLVAIEGNESYFKTGLLEPTLWDIDSSPKPEIPENLLTQVNKSSLQHLCEKSSFEFHLTEPCGEEHCLLAQQVFSLVNDLLKKCSEMDPRMKSKVYWTGSSSEGTKMWLPDEFDFLMELVELKDCCYIEETLRSPRNLILHQKCGTVWSNLCDGDFVLSSRKLRNYISNLLEKGSLKLNRQNYPNIRFNLCRYDRELNCFLNDTKVGVNLTVRWNGEVYKNLTVSIDLTPAIPIVISEQQMNVLHEHARKELADRCIHVVPYLKPGDQLKGWRPSFSLIEVRIVKSLTKKQIALYKCLKFLRDLHGNVLVHIPSYHLKTFLLTTLYQNQDEQIVEIIERETFYSSVCAVMVLLKQIARYPLDRRAIQHFFLKLPLSLVDYDLRWCESMWRHLEFNRAYE